MHDHSQTVIIYPNMIKLLGKTKNWIGKKKREKKKKKRFVIEVYEFSWSFSTAISYTQFHEKTEKNKNKK